jgi:RimJ/RimL family protein N-acetyltransferase
MTVTLETPRLSLRELVASDLDFLAEMLADPEVMQYYPKVCTRDEAQVWLERQFMRYSRDGHGLWLVSVRDTGRPIGQVGLMLQQVEDHSLHEIGYLLHRPFWGSGFATEAGLSVREYAFGIHKVSEVISLVRPENLPSQAVARRLGMTADREVLFHGILHLVFSSTGEACDRSA